MGQLCLPDFKKAIVRKQMVLNNQMLPVRNLNAFKMGMETPINDRTLSLMSYVSLEIVTVAKCLWNLSVTQGNNSEIPIFFSCTLEDFAEL